MNDTVGIIGFGSMGRMIAEGFIAGKVIAGSKIFLATRSRSKLEDFKKRFSDVNICGTNAELADKSRTIFICAKGGDFTDIFDEIKPHVNADTHLVSINLSIANETMERILPCKVSKLLPTVIGEINRGIIPVCHGYRVNAHDKERIHSLFAHMGTIAELDEKDLGIATELTSCMPGLLSGIFNELLKASLSRSNLSSTTIESFLRETIYGTAKLYREKNISFDDTIKRVATKGGLTEVGVNIFRENLPDVFDKVFEQTMARREATVKKLNEDLLRNDG